MGIGTLEEGAITPFHWLEGKRVSQDESVVAGAVKATRVRLLDITALSQLKEKGHISQYSLKASDGVQDCLHWWLPGIPDTWNEILYAQLLVAD